MGMEGLRHPQHVVGQVLSVRVHGDHTLRLGAVVIDILKSRLHGSAFAAVHFMVKDCDLLPFRECGKQRLTVLAAAVVHDDDGKFCLCNQGIYHISQLLVRLVGRDNDHHIAGFSPKKLFPLYHSTQKKEEEKQGTCHRFVNCL